MRCCSAKSAGTEDAKQERERKNINTSLLSLGRVITSLKNKEKQVRERDAAFPCASAAILPKSDALILAVLQLIDQSVVHAANVDYPQA